MEVDIIYPDIDPNLCKDASCYYCYVPSHVAQHESVRTGGNNQFCGSLALSSRTIISLACALSWGLGSGFSQPRWTGAYHTVLVIYAGLTSRRTKLSSIIIRLNFDFLFAPVPILVSSPSDFSIFDFPRLFFVFLLLFHPIMIPRLS